MVMNGKSSEIKLSIIIATYNAGLTLEKALNSVISLKYSDWECLIIDGQSKDDTLKIISKFEKEDERIKHISEKDNGIYDAFNKGWKKASGEWIYYLGADDHLTCDGMSLLMQRTVGIDEQIAIVSGGVFRVCQDGNQHIIMSKDFVGSHQSMVTRRSVLEKMGGFDYRKYKILADYDLFIRIKNSGYGVINCPAIVAYFHAGGTSERLDMMKQIIKEKYNILKSDAYCKSPFLLTLKDSLRTIIGSFLHRIIKNLKKR